MKLKITDHQGVRTYAVETLPEGSGVASTVREVLAFAGQEIDWEKEAVLGAGMVEYIPDTPIEVGDTITVIPSDLWAILNREAAPLAPADAEALDHAADAMISDALQHAS